MGIFGALTTAVSGMRAQSFALENISGNIANSQTTAFKRIDTSFVDLIPDALTQQQTAGDVMANSRSTNVVQGDIQTASISTFMAIDGDGFFVVQKPSNFQDNRPVFDGIDLYTRRGDFQPDKNGYLVNGDGYYLMGIPVDATTGNLVGSVPQLLQFQNNLLAAQATTQIQYRANLASYPLTVAHDTSVPGSELLNPINFQRNPIAGIPQPAKITGAGATLLPDAFAVMNGTANISALSSAGGTLQIGTTNITIPVGADSTAVVNAINAQTATTNVSAAMVGNTIQLTGTTYQNDVTVGAGTSANILTELGLAATSATPTNLLTQSAVLSGQHFKIKIGSAPELDLVFGTTGTQISTLSQLSAQLGTLAGGTATVDATGNITVTGSSTGTGENITVSGDVSAATFGMQTSFSMPSNGTVIGNDATAFLNETIGGGAITAYDVSGSPVNIQLRWAKVDSSTTGGQDKWNLFYQVNSNATGTQVAWQNAGQNFAFAADGQINPPISSLTLNNVVVDGATLGNVQVAFGPGGLTQFSDPNGTVNVNQLQQNGFPAGVLQQVSVNDKGRLVGTYSNGRSIDLAEITLATFSGANGLKRIDGGAFEATDESGAATFDAPGKIVSSSLESSNTDIADEFSKLIVTQQAYSANTRVITTANQMVQDLLNMLR
jgi:flagellar hook protein FlgE